jgi:hypothetical protein
MFEAGIAGDRRVSVSGEQCNLRSENGTAEANEIRAVL